MQHKWALLNDLTLRTFGAACLLIELPSREREVNIGLTRCLWWPGPINSGRSGERTVCVLSSAALASICLNYLMWQLFNAIHCARRAHFVVGNRWRLRLRRLTEILFKRFEIWTCSPTGGPSPSTLLSVYYFRDPPVEKWGRTRAKPITSVQIIRDEKRMPGEEGSRAGFPAEVNIV